MQTGLTVVVVGGSPTQLQGRVVLTMVDTQGPLSGVTHSISGQAIPKGLVIVVEAGQVADTPVATKLIAMMEVSFIFPAVSRLAHL